MKYLIHPESDSTFECECHGREADCCLQDGCVSEVDYETYANFRRESGETSLDQPLSDVLLIAHRKTANPNRRDHSVNVTLTISVEHPSELPAAVLALVEPAKRGRKAKPEVTDAPTAPAEGASPAEVVAARIAAVSAETAPTPTEEPAAASTPTVAPTVAIDKKVVTDTLVAVVQKHKTAGRDIVGAICRANGAPNLSALAESTYPEVYKAGQMALAMETEAAKAKFAAVAA
jgi:hypothetical protein